MSGNRRNHNHRQDAPRSGRNDSLRSESDPSQQDMHQLTIGLQSSSIREPNLPAHAPPPSRPPYQPQGYQSYQPQAPRDWGAPPPPPYAENQPDSQPLLGNPQQLASRRRVQGGFAAAQPEASLSAHGGTQPNTGRAQAHAQVSDNPNDVMVLGRTPQDTSWTAEQMDRMRAYKKENNNARWKKVAHEVGGGHKPFDCENKWLKMERVRMKEELEEKEGKGKEGKGEEGKGKEGKGKEGIGKEGKGKEGKGKESKRDRSPDTEDKEDRAGPPDQRQRK